jgi:hypothetical protein
MIRNNRERNIESNRREDVNKITVNDSLEIGG